MNDSPIKLMIAWGGLKKPVIDEMAAFLACNDRHDIPGWMLAKGNGGPGPAPEDQYSEEYDEWCEKAGEFVEKLYPGVEYPLFDEDYGSRFCYSHFTPYSHDMGNVAKALENGYLKGISDILKHHGLDSVVSLRLCNGDDCEMKMYAVTRAGICEETVSEWHIEEKARQELAKVLEKEAAGEKAAGPKGHPHP